MAKIRPDVWCDISCTECGALADGSGFYYTGIIKVLKQNTKDWIVKDGGAVCPGCAKECGYDKEI